MSNERKQLIARLRRFAVVLEARGETYDAETCEQAIASLSAPVAEPLIVTKECAERGCCAHRVLRMAVDAMLAPLGHYGEISARDDRVQAVMDAMAQCDEIER